MTFKFFSDDDSLPDYIKKMEPWKKENHIYHVTVNLDNVPMNDNGSYDRSSILLGVEKLPHDTLFSSLKGKKRYLEEIPPKGKPTFFDSADIKCVVLRSYSVDESRKYTRVHMDVYV